MNRGIDIEARSSDGEGASHIAAREKLEDIVRILLDRGADVDVQSSGGETALHIAARSWLGDVVRILLDKGADLDVKCRKGETPLDKAIEKRGYMAKEQRWLSKERVERVTQSLDVVIELLRSRQIENQSAQDRAKKEQEKET